MPHVISIKSVFYNPLIHTFSDLTFCFLENENPASFFPVTTCDPTVMDVDTEREYARGAQLLQDNGVRAGAKRVYALLTFLSLTVVATLILLATLPFRLFTKLCQSTRENNPPDLSIPITVHDPDKASAPDEPRDTILLIHGFPDSSALWHATVRTLVKAGYRCLVVDLPASRGKLSTRDLTFAKVARAIRDAVISAGFREVTVIGHDWGAMYTHMLATFYPDMVKRLVFLDVAGTTNVSLADTVCIMSYQLYFVVCYFLGHPIGSWGVRFAAYLFKYDARPLSEITADMVWPYPVIVSKIVRSGVSQKEQSQRSDHTQPQSHSNVPIFFAYGAEKEFFFHDLSFLQQVRASPGGRIQAFESGHWFFLKCSDQWLNSLKSWLDHTHRFVSSS